MRVCVVGAGSIGGYVGVKLALAGEEVTLIARGPHLEAIKRDGLKLIMHDGAEHVAKDVKATRHMAEAGPQDVVILAVKAHQVEPIAEDLRTLFGPETAMVTMQNGIPWWYFQKHGGEFDGRGLRTVDPNGVIARNIDPERIVGCVVYPAAEIEAPGVIRHVEGDRFPIGELDGKERERTRKISQMFVNAGFKSPILENIRAEIWLKLWGNMTFNPISALTHSTLVDICQHRDTRQLARFIMQEAQTVAGRLGIEFRVPLEKRIAGAEKVGKHKTSMLQDVEAGRYIEIDALAGSVVELGNLTDIPTPSTFAVYACAKLLGDLINHERVSVRAQKLS